VGATQGSVAGYEADSEMPPMGYLWLRSGSKKERENRLIPKWAGDSNWQTAMFEAFLIIEDKIIYCKYE